jgi:hypothetical protein
MADTFWDDDKLTRIIIKLQHADRLSTAQAFSSKPSKQRTEEVLEKLHAAQELLEDVISDVEAYAKKKGVKVK